MKTIAIAFLFSLFAASVSAQTTPHPCDAMAPANPVLVKDAVIVGFCHNGKDLAGKVVPLTAFKVTIDGAVALTWTGPTLTATSPTANSAGYLYYEAPAISVSRGTHAVAVSAVNADGESALSLAYAFSTKGPGPSLIIGVRVR